ncbi:MAG: ATP-binding cassette domain-containing protein [Rhizobacter sp.]
MTTPSSSTVLQVQDLCFAYPDQPPLAARWSARIPAGLTLLHGDTGSGKSTLLRLLAGTQAVDGRLTLRSASFDVDPVAYRRMVFWHEPGTDAFDQLTPRELASAVCADQPGFDEAAWQQHALGFGLAPHLHKALYMLSTGSRRKAMLAAALASTRALTLLDEPTGALDAPSVAYLMQALATFAASSDRAIVVASSERLDALPLAALIELPLR